MVFVKYGSGMLVCQRLSLMVNVSKMSQRYKSEIQVHVALIDRPV